MTVLRGSIGNDGASVQIEIGVSRANRRALLAAHRPIPQPITICALIDTGADVSCIDSAVLKQIALQRRRAFLLVNAPGTGGLQYQLGYLADVRVSHPSGRPAGCLIIPDLLVAELPLQLSGCQFLFGRYALSYCRFEYDGQSVAYALEY